MSSILRNVLAVILGVCIGSIVNMSIINAGPMIVPLPDGVDMSNQEMFAENLKRFKPINFAPVFAAHALGTFAGAFIAAWIASRHKLAIAMGIGVFFLIGGATMVVMYGGPIWFIVLDLVGAYLPMGYLGYMLAPRSKPQQPSLDG